MLIYAQLLNSEKEQSCPISYYTTAKGLGARQEGGRCRFQTPLAQNPALPLTTEVLFASDNGAKRGLLRICSQNWVVRVSNGKTGSIQTPLFPGLPKRIAAQHRGTDSLFEGMPLHMKCLRTSSSADWCSPARWAPLQALWCSTQTCSKWSENRTRYWYPEWFHLLQHFWVIPQAKQLDDRSFTVPSVEILGICKKKKKGQKCQARKGRSKNLITLSLLLLGRHARGNNNNEDRSQ